MSDVETALQLEKAKASQGKIPAGLSFDKLVKNQTLSPFSLNDFMDYLFYVEHSAEPLQFFLWYCDYVQRWSNLLPRQKALAPIWDPETASEPRSRYITYSHKRARSEKMNKIISIMEMANSDQGSETDETYSHTRDGSSTSKVSRARTSSGSSIMSPTDCKDDWQPFTVQPFRDEVSRIARHYIAESGPRRLNLVQQDRERCLHAVQHTTHPSALLPAFVVAEAMLKGQSHPNFVRWSMSNSNRPRVIFLRVVGLAFIALGLGLDVFLILSGLNHFLRILCIALLWPGLTVAISAFRGISILLHLKNVRHLRPWEQFGDLEHHTDYDRKDVEPPWPAPADDNDPHPHPPPPVAGGGGAAYRQHSRKDTSSSVGSAFSRIDPLRKSSLQTFGPGNDPGSEPWVGRYAAKPLRERVFEAATPVQNQSLQLLRDRAVFLAVLWGGLVSSAVAVASLFVPSEGLFL